MVLGWLDGEATAVTAVDPASETTAEQRARQVRQRPRPHVAVLVDSADDHTAEAEQRGIVDRVVDAANTKAVFVWGPDRVRIEYVEHKPEFSLT